MGDGTRVAHGRMQGARAPMLKLTSLHCRLQTLPLSLFRWRRCDRQWFVTQVASDSSLSLSLGNDGGGERTKPRRTTE